MQTMIRKALFVGPFFLGLCFTSPFSISAENTAIPASAVEIAYQEFRLSNGLRVIVHEDRKAPIVSVNLWYHVGSKNEKPGRTGFAHLFEHLMFQGSENYPDEFFKPFESAGATEQNGTTNTDRTNYFQNVPTTALDMALFMESDRMGYLLGAIDQKSLDEQRGVVQNEKRQRDNAPYGKDFYALFEAIFPEGHPYRWSTIGSMEDLEAASLTDVKTWFKTWYGPDNTVLVLAGDIDLATAKTKVEKYFGGIAPGGPLAKRTLMPVQLDAPTRGVNYDRVAQTRITRVWGAPAATMPAADDLALFARALGGGKTSRLYQRLVQKEQLATSASAFSFGLEIAGMFIVSVDLAPNADVAKVEAIIDEEIKALNAGGLTQAELARAATSIEAGFIRGIERTGGFGGKSDILAECAVFFGNPDCYKAELQRLTTATPARVLNTANQWITSNHHTLITAPFQVYKKGEALADRAKGPPETTEFPDLRFPALQRGSLKNGIEVIVAQRPEVPLVQMQMLFDAGFAGDVGRPLGSSSIVMNMLDEGTEKLTAVQIAETAEALGAQIGTANSLDFSSVSMSALTKNLKPTLELFSDVVRNPSFAASELDRVKRQTLAQITQEKTQPGSMALRTLAPLLYGEGHPYAIPLTGSGTESSVSAMTQADLKRFYDAAIRPDNARIIVVGDISLGGAIAALESTFGDWKPSAAAKLNKPLNEVAVNSAPRIYLIDKPNAEQSLILAGSLIPSSKAPDRLALQTANSVFGGEFSARLNMNLREDKHWAYGAYSFPISAVGQRPLIAQANVQTDKTVESFQEIVREFSEFSSTKPASSAEIAKWKSSDVRSLPGQFATNAAVLGTIAEMISYGRPDNYVQTLKASIEAQTDAQVNAAAQAYFKPQPLTWVVVGDLAKFEPALRALKIGDVQVLDADGKRVEQ